MAHRRIAVLGATGYIGRSLLHEGLARADAETVPFVRDRQRAGSALRAFGIEAPTLRTYDALFDIEFEALVNAAGIGSPRALAADPRLVFEVTESMDKLVLAYLERYPRTRVFNLSSGAVYNAAPDAPGPGSTYAAAKLASEAKHRAYPEYALIDLRVFSFFSRFVDLEDRFLLSEMVACVRSSTVFQTSADDLTRDYATARGLYDLIRFFLARPPANLAADVATRSPVTKFQLLDHFRQAFGLRYELSSRPRTENPTGRKDNYVPHGAMLEQLGFLPKETSLEGIDREMRAHLANSSASA